MRNKIVSFLLFVNLLNPGNIVYGQSNDTIIFNTLGNFIFSFTYSGYTPLIDRLGRPYVYLSTKELGLITFDISDEMNPIPVDTIPKTMVNNLKVVSETQNGNYLFLSLGEFTGANLENAGLAIFNISNPVLPVLLDEWDSTAFAHGSTTVICQGNYVYLGAMGDGVLILDISDLNNIKFVSQIIPDLAFGTHQNTYHSRGLFISGDTLLVADDAGGLRIIDVTDKQNPVETGKYYSSAIDSAATGYYNHVYRIGNSAFCALDFCGFEVVNVANPNNMYEEAWLDPWNCTGNPPPYGSWQGSEGHTNEIAYDSTQNVLMFSGSDSQVIALDPSNPGQTRMMGEWGQVNDSIASWGVDVFGNLVAIANYNNPFGLPMYTVKGGLQLLNWSVVQKINENFVENTPLNIYPNPAGDKVNITLPSAKFTNYGVEISDVFGQKMFSSEINSKNTHDNKISVNVSRLPNAMYIVTLKNKNRVQTGKIIINH